MSKAAKLLLSGVIIMMGAHPSAADTARPAPLPQVPQRSIQTYGEDNKACREWTDGCVICIRGEGDQASCSLPGIACQAAGLRCQVMTKTGLKP